MKIKFLFVFLVTAFYSFGFCKPVIVIEERVKSYLNGQSGKDNKRSNLIRIVEVNEETHKTYDELKRFFSKTYNVYDFKNDALRVKKNNVILDISKMNVNRDTCARHMLRKIMPVEFVDKFKLVSVDIERSFSKKYGSKIEGFRFNFTRLFNGRVVYDSKNFLIIRTNENGLLKDARIALQDLKESTEYVEIGGGYNENMQTLDSLLNEKPVFVKEVNQDGEVKSEKIEKIQINGVANAYCKVDVDKSKKFFPCLLYSSEIKLSDGENFGYIISTPHSRKSWSDKQK